MGLTFAGGLFSSFLTFSSFFVSGTFFTIRSLKLNEPSLLLVIFIFGEMSVTSLTEICFLRRGRSFGLTRNCPAATKVPLSNDGFSETLKPLTLRPLRPTDILSISTCLWRTSDILAINMAFTFAGGNAILKAIVPPTKTNNKIRKRISRIFLNFFIYLNILSEGLQF